MPLFGSSKKGPAEISKILIESFVVLESADPKGKKSEKVFFLKNIFVIYVAF